MLGALERLGSVMADAGWVTEDPIEHLGPKLRAWLEADGGVRWTEVVLAEDGPWLVVTARWARTDGRLRDLRADAYALIGSFAEEAAHAAQVRAGTLIEFEIATGQLTGDFAPHGHLVRFRPTGAEVERAVAGLR
jgi:hypothetical protein